jgi:hypothetical protein
MSECAALNTFWRAPHDRIGGPVPTHTLGARLGIVSIRRSAPCAAIALPVKVRARLLRAAFPV